MKKLTIIIVFLSLGLQSAFAFNVVNLKNTKVKANTKVFTKLDKNEDKIEGRLTGLAQIESIAKEEQIEQEKFRITITWNEYINKDGSKIELSNNSLSSTILSKNDVIKPRQIIKVQGNLSSLNQGLSALQGQQSGKGEETSETKNYAIPSSSGSSSNYENDTELGTAEFKTKETSGVDCSASFDFNTGMATIYVEEYYVKDDGTKLVTKDCYASSEVLSISYEACDYTHEFDKEQSWKKEKPYVNSSYGTKSLNCMITSDAIPHQYDDSKCDILILEGGIAMVQAKRFITVDTRNIYISDCEIVDKQGIEVDLRGCSINMYDVVENSYQVYPAGKRYVYQGNQRVYIDSSCKVLIDFGKPWETRFSRYQHIDSRQGWYAGYSKQWNMYYYDFSEYEGGGVTDIEEYYTGLDHSHVHYHTSIKKGKGCDGFFSNDHWYDRYYHWRRPDNSTYNHYAYGVCT